MQGCRSEFTGSAGGTIIRVYDRLSIPMRGLDVENLDYRESAFYL